MNLQEQINLSNLLNGKDTALEFNKLILENPEKKLKDGVVSTFVNLGKFEVANNLNAPTIVVKPSVDKIQRGELRRRVRNLNDIGASELATPTFRIGKHLFMPVGFQQLLSFTEGQINQLFPTYQSLVEVLKEHLFEVAFELKEVMALSGASARTSNDTLVENRGLLTGSTATTIPTTTYLGLFQKILQETAKINHKLGLALKQENAIVFISTGFYNNLLSQMFVNPTPAPSVAINIQQFIEQLTSLGIELKALDSLTDKLDANGNVVGGEILIVNPYDLKIYLGGTDRLLDVQVKSTHGQSTPTYEFYHNFYNAGFNKFCGNNISYLKIDAVS